jgi:transposase
MSAMGHYFPIAPSLPVLNATHCEWQLLGFPSCATRDSNGQEELPMSDQYLLTETQLERIRPYFPRSHGKPRVDDRRVIGDKGYDSDEFRDALKARKIKACIPPRSNRTAPSSYSKTLYRRRHKIENMFAKLKDWRRIAARYDRCVHKFMSAICIAATVIFWINQ